MPEFVSVLQDGKSKTVVTVTKERADALGLRVLKSEPAVDRRGRPLGPRERGETDTSTATANTTKEGSR